MAKKSKVIIPCRMAYVNCWRPNSKFGTPRYSLVAIISKNDVKTINEIRESIEYVKNKSIDKWGGIIPENFRLPLHDGDAEKSDNPIFENSYYINAKCKDAPQIVDHNVETITNEDELYSGCYGYVSMTFYAYNCGINKGISVLLGNIQKIRDAPKLNGRALARDEFKPITRRDREVGEEKE